MSSGENSYVEEVPVVQVVYEHEMDSSEEPPMEEWSSLQFELPEENVKRLLEAEGLYDPGSGEICTKYIAMSASSVLRHPYYNYPAIPDPGVEEALLHPIPKIIYSDDGQELYLAICKEMNICPIRSFYRQLLEEKIDLKYYGINPTGFRAIGMAMKLNRFVKSMDLTDNWIDKDGCFHIGEMLVSNITLRELNLSGCRMGAEGARNFFYSLPLNRTLRKLDLSRNKLGDAGLEYFAKAIFLGTDVAEVNLSFNQIGGKSILVLAEAFETNNKFTYLDLSWNNILSPNAIFTLCQRLSENNVFEELNLSWNSLSGARIGFAMRNLFKAPRLRRVYLTNNRLDGPAINTIGANLVKATKLEVLDLSYNPLSPKDALNLLHRLHERRVKLQKLILDNVFVTSEFMELREEILALKYRKNTVITWGALIPTFVPKGVDARDLVLNRAEAICKKSKKNPIDIALVIMELYKLDKEPMGQKEFTRALKSRGAILDDDLIDEIANVFGGPRTAKTKTINLAAMIDFFKRKWPDRHLPPTPPPEPEPEPKKKEKGKKNKK